MVDVQQFILATWLALSLLLAGLGALVHRAWRMPVEGADGWIRCFWLGWATLLLLLQLWHFAWPIDDRAVLLLVAPGLAGLLLAGARPWMALGRRARAHLPALVVLALAACWLSNRSMGGASNGDTGYYFVPTVVWLKEHPLVVGLANLSAPLGYNQTYFDWVALLDRGPFLRGSHHLANGILLLALFARGLLGASRALRGASATDLFHVAFLPVVVQQAFGLNLTSPAPDFAVFVLGVVLSGEWIDLLTRRGDASRALPALALLSAAAIGVKLSLLGLAVATLAAASMVVLRRGAAARTLAAAAVIVAAWTAPWLAGNVMLSGYPLFPSTALGVPVAWRVPDDVAGMIRDTSSLHGSISLAWQDPRWFLNSLDSLGWNTGEVLVPLGLAAAAVVVGPLVRLLRRRSPPGPGVPLLAIVPVVFALVFWFQLAPRPRFAGAALWLLGVESVLVALGPVIAGRAGGRVAAVLAVFLAAMVFHDGAPSNWNRPGFEPDSTRAIVHAVALADGLVVQVAERSNCWYTPPPCTPELQPGLRLREPGNLSAGFVVDAPSSP